MKTEIKQILIDCANFIQPYADGGNEAEILMERLNEALEQGQSLPTQNVSGISLQQLNLQKECYRERKERNGKATAYGEAHTDEIREGVIDHLIALCNYR